MSTLECVNNNEDMNLSYEIKLKIYTWLGKCSLKHSYSLATFLHVVSLPDQSIAIDYAMIKIQGKDTACKPDQCT